MERLSVTLRDFPNPRNPRRLIVKPSLEFPGMPQSGLGGRGYSGNLDSCDK